VLQTAADRELVTIRVRERLVEVSGPLAPETVTAAAAVDAAKQGLEFQQRSDGRTWVLIRRERRLVAEMTPGAENVPELNELAALLNLIPGVATRDLIVAPTRAPDPLRHPSPPSAELRITPRSTAQVYRYLANGVQVPQEHLAAGIARPPCVVQGCELTGGLFTVCTSAGHKPPCNAYVAIKYRDWWYYIDDRDAQSKSTLALMLQLVRLDLRNRPPGGGPLLTLPAGR
jgi:hypothetical protein